MGRGGAERPPPTEQTTCRPAPAPCPRDPRTRSRPPCGSSPNGQDRVQAWGAQRLEPRCRASGRRTMVVIVAQLSYIEHGSQDDRKSVVEGKSVSVRVDLGGLRIIKKKKNKKN